MKKIGFLLLLLFAISLIPISSSAEEAKSDAFATLLQKHASHVVAVSVAVTTEDEEGEAQTTSSWYPGVRLSDNKVLFSAYNLPDDPITDTKYKIYQGKVPARASLKAINVRENIAIVEQSSGSPKGLSFATGEEIEVGNTYFAAMIQSESSDFAPMIIEFSITAEIDRGGQKIYTTDIVSPAEDYAGLFGIPAFNAEGKTIGFINVARGDSSMTLALYPSSYIRKAVSAAINPSDSSLRKCWFGAFTSELSSALKEKLSLPGDLQGSLIESVIPDSPAHKAGLKTLDIVLAANGVAIAGPDAADLDRYFANNFRPGNKVLLNVFRDGKRIEVEVELTKSPTDLFEAENHHFEELGLRVQELTLDIRLHLGLKNSDEGILVRQVSTNGAFDSSAIQTIGVNYDVRNGIVIVKANGKDIKTVDDLKTVFEDAKKNKLPITFFVRYNKQNEAGCINTSFIKVNFNN